MDCHAPILVGARKDNCRGHGQFADFQLVRRGKGDHHQASEVFVPALPEKQHSSSLGEEIKRWGVVYLTHIFYLSPPDISSSMICINVLAKKFDFMYLNQLQCKLICPTIQKILTQNN